MRVRGQNLLGNDVHTAAFVEVPDELRATGGTELADVKRRAGA